MTLEAENTRLRTENEELKKQLVYISHELDQLKKMVFGRRSERSKTLYYDNGQQSLFKDDELPAEEEPKKVKTHIRQKVKTGNKPKRIIFPADLPREDQILNPEGIEEDRYEKIGEDITEILAYQPGNIFVKRIIRPRWALKNEEKSEEHQKTILQENIPPRLISRGLVDESLVAHIIEEKILHHTPVYRQAKKLKQIGTILSRPEISTTGFIDLLRHYFLYIIYYRRTCSLLRICRQMKVH